MNMIFRGSRRPGFTLIELMVVVAIIGFLAGLTVPSFVRARKSSQTNACINNLREIDNAKHQWALETGHLSAAVPQDFEIRPYLGRGTGSLNNVFCPVENPTGPLAGYVINPIADPPECQNQSPVHPALLN